MGGGMVWWSNHRPTLSNISEGELSQTVVSAVQMHLTDHGQLPLNLPRKPWKTDSKSLPSSCENPPLHAQSSARDGMSPEETSTWNKRKHISASTLTLWKLGVLRAQARAPNSLSMWNLCWFHVTVLAAAVPLRLSIMWQSQLEEGRAERNRIRAPKKNCRVGANTPQRLEDSALNDPIKRLVTVHSMTLRWPRDTCLLCNMQVK
jgi:hypothetical protein